MLIAINYHYIRENFIATYPSIFGVTPIQFSEQIDVMSKQLSFVGVSDIIDAIDGKKALPRRAGIITFDDGLAEQFELAWPILQAKGIPAVFFVNTLPIEKHAITATHKIHIIRAHVPQDVIIKTVKSYCEKSSLKFRLPDISRASSAKHYDEPEVARLKYFLNHLVDARAKEDILNDFLAELGFNEKKLSQKLYMSRSQIKSLADSESLGTHGHSHQALGLLSSKEAKDDVQLSICKLHQWTGSRVRVMSYPFGFHDACSRAAATAAHKLGVRFAFTMERAVNRELRFPMFLSRFDINDVMSNGGDLHDKMHSKAVTRSWFRTDQGIPA